MTESNELKGVGAEEYDLNKLAFPYYDDFQRAIADLVVQHDLQLDKRSKIIDLGVGTGDTSKAVLQHEGLTKLVNLTCVDFDPVLIKQAKRKLLPYQNRANHVNFICKRAEEYFPTLKENSVDVIFSALTLHNHPPGTRKRIYQEASRVLNEEGILVLGDKFASRIPRDHLNEMTRMIMGYLHLLEIGRRDVFEYWIRHNLRDDQPDLQMTRSCRTTSEIMNSGFYGGAWFETGDGDPNPWGMDQILVAYKSQKGFWKVRRGMGEKK